MKNLLQLNALIAYASAIGLRSTVVQNCNVQCEGSTPDLNEADCTCICDKSKHEPTSDLSAWNEDVCDYDALQPSNSRGYQVKAQYTVKQKKGSKVQLGPENLIRSKNHANNKWATGEIPGGKNESWVVVETPKPVHIRGFGFTSANNVPESDPDTVEIMVDDQTFVFDLNFDEERLSTIDFLDDIDVTSNIIKFNFANKDHDEIQLRQILFYEPICSTGKFFDNISETCACRATPAECSGATPDFNQDTCTCTCDPSLHSPTAGHPDWNEKHCNYTCIKSAHPVPSTPSIWSSHLCDYLPALNIKF